MGKTKRKARKENHEDKVTKIPKTKRRKYGMNETDDIESYHRKLLKNSNHFLFSWVKT